MGLDKKNYKQKKKVGEKMVYVCKMKETKNTQIITTLNTWTTIPPNM